VTDWQELLEEYTPQEYPLLHDHKFERMGDINPTVFGDATEEDATVVAEEEEQSQDNIDKSSRRSSTGSTGKSKKRGLAQSQQQQQQHNMYRSGQMSRKSSKQQRQFGAGVIPTRSVSFARSGVDPDSDGMVEIELSELSDGRKRSSVSSRGSVEEEVEQDVDDVHVVAEDEWADDKLEDDIDFESDNAGGGQIEGQATSPLGTRLIQMERKRSAAAAAAAAAEASTSRKPSTTTTSSAAGCETKQRAFRTTPLSPVEKTREHRRDLRRLRRERILYGVRVLRRLRLKKMITRTKATAYDFQDDPAAQGEGAAACEGSDTAPAETEDVITVRMSLDDRTYAYSICITTMSGISGGSWGVNETLVNLQRTVTSPPRHERTRGSGGSFPGSSLIRHPMHRYQFFLSGVHRCVDEQSQNSPRVCR
jgi:hypothetical protein